MPSYITFETSGKKYNFRFVFSEVDIPFVHTKLSINCRKMDLAQLLVIYLTNVFKMIAMKFFPIGLWRYNLEKMTPESDSGGWFTYETCLDR